MVFASAKMAHKCLTTLKGSITSEDPQSLKTARFFMPPESSRGCPTFHWANFSAVLVPSTLWKLAMAFWRDTGSGLSTRHAEFCMGQLDYLDCDSENPVFRSPAPLKRGIRKAAPEVANVQLRSHSTPELKRIIAELATSDQPGEPVVRQDDVFFYPTGMNAIYSLSETLLSMRPDSNVAAFGYVLTLSSTITHVENSALT